jgi:hypothetical protein
MPGERPGPDDSHIFSPRELHRLAVYRQAVADKFYSDQDENYTPGNAGKDQSKPHGKPPESKR